MNRFSKYLNFLILLIFAATVFFRGVVIIDPDLGWHLREGQLILQSGIPATDPFSYTMSSYAFIDHEWMQNVIMYSVFNSFGMFGLAFFYAVIFAGIFFVISTNKFNNFTPIPLLLTGLIMLDFTGVRTQEVTWLFLAILLRIILDKNAWSKFKYFVPLIFLPWVNLHGGFAVGIVILLLYFVLNSIKNKKISFDNLIIFILSLLATFINPYGTRIWHEIWMQITDNNLHIYIKEWFPIFFDFDLALGIMLSLSLFSIYIYRKKLNLVTLGIFAFLLLMAISSTRHVMLWVISAVLLVSETLYLFFKEVRKNKDSLARLKMARNFVVIFLLIFSVFKFYNVLTTSDNRNSYPQNAVFYLKSQKINGNIFTTYDFGGYLIWKLPKEKVFIDGRMPSWRRSGYFPNESNYAFTDYLKMLSNDKFFISQIKKYHISYLLLPRYTIITKNTVIDKINNFFEKFIYKDIDYHVLSEDLTKKGMTRVYGDGQFIIYKTNLF